MTPMLAPLVGDAPTVTFIGLCKNAGKTTAMCRLMEELPGETLALTSVGRDGERTDVVTGTEKPEIWVRAGTLFATARGMLPLCDATLRVEAVTDVMTPLGAVGILRALSDGYIQLAGPSAVSQLGPLSRTFRALGAQRVLIDGAAGRRSLAGVEPGAAAILCVGASVDGGITIHMIQSNNVDRGAVRQVASRCKGLAGPMRGVNGTTAEGTGTLRGTVPAPCVRCVRSVMTTRCAIRVRGALARMAYLFSL